MCVGSENAGIIIIIMNSVGFLILQEPTLPLQGQSCTILVAPGFGVNQMIL